jgi:hypothetical protein
MAQTLFSSPTTCQSCPCFDNYQDEQGRGWCRAFNQAARLYHPRTRDCDWVKDSVPPQAVSVELQSKAVEDDGCGYPIPVDSQVLQVTVHPFTQAAVETALQSLLDLSEWEIARIWQPERESEF